MGAENPTRRAMTAREGAKRFGVSPRTIRKVMAEPREQYEARARERQERVIALRREGLKLTEIAARVGMTTGGVGATLHVARKRGIEV